MLKQLHGCKTSSPTSRTYQLTLPLGTQDQEIFLKNITEMVSDFEKNPTAYKKIHIILSRNYYMPGAEIDDYTLLSWSIPLEIFKENLALIKNACLKANVQESEVINLNVKNTENHAQLLKEICESLKKDRAWHVRP